MGGESWDEYMARISHLLTERQCRAVQNIRDKAYSLGMGNPHADFIQEVFNDWVIEDVLRLFWACDSHRLEVDVNIKGDIYALHFNSITRECEDIECDHDRDIAQILDLISKISPEWPSLS